MSEANVRPTVGEAFRVFLYIGLNSFGGPAGQIAVMHRVLVEERKWLSEQRFLHALNYCMLLPGPEAMQLATYAGWLLHGTLGGVMAGLLFVLPGASVMLLLSSLYASLHDLGWMAALFFGIKAAVVIVVIEALLKVSRRALHRRAHVAIAVAAFLLLFLFNAPFPLVILGAAVAGSFLPVAPKTDEAELETPGGRVRPVGHVLRVLAVWLPIWGAPALWAWAAGEDLLLGLAVFFSKAAMVTFGGAYSVLLFLSQQVVNVHHWVEPGQMVDGLGLAETTPGPLILVNQFAGYLAGYQHRGGTPWVGGVLGGLMASWMTFAPCFLWIFLGAPFIEQLRGNKKLSAALSGITAAVVGVIANLSIWFALHTFFSRAQAYPLPGLHVSLPDPSSLNLAAVVIAAGAGVALLRMKLGMLPVLGACAGAGLALHAFGLVAMR